MTTSLRALGGRGGRRLGRRAPVPCVAALCFAALAATTASAADPPDQAVAYQLNPRHDGSIVTEGLDPPLELVWKTDLGDTVSYPLIAEGKVFVTVRGIPEIGQGVPLFAIDATDGSVAWGPVEITGNYFRAGTAYEDGRLFVINFEGLLRAFDADTGKIVWSSDLPEQTYAVSSMPTAVDGVVYVVGAGAGGTLYAVEADTGGVLWAGRGGSGDQSSPAVAGDGVYVSFACDHAFRFDRDTGALVWEYVTSCFGGGGRTPVYYDGRIYSRYTNEPRGYVLDAEDGAPLWQYDVEPAPAFHAPAPAFHAGRGFFVRRTELTCRAPDSGDAVWTFEGGGADLVTAPIVVNGVVYVGSEDGDLYALDPTSGNEVWRGSVDGRILPPDEHNVTGPLVGMGAGEGILVVSASDELVGFRSANPPEPPPTEFVRGDPNASGQVDVSDVVSVLRYAYFGLPESVRCEDAGDPNDDGAIDLEDALEILGFLFLEAPPPPAPQSDIAGECAPDDSEDALRCASYPPCG
jgi:outer membrane protein assembly factor BamB